MRPSMPISCRQTSPSMQVPLSHPVANCEPHSATSPDGHVLHAWSAIAPLI
jgi:hypothetical protein